MMKTMKSPKAVLFDVDGTLYAQAPVRLLMAAELAAARCSLERPNPGVRAARILALFRRIREELRGLEPSTESLERLQFTEAARRAGESPAFVRRTVGDWMFQRPLKYLRLARRRRVIELAVALAQAGFKLGVLSDYPVAEKLAALQLTDILPLQLCTTDPEINALKPHPRGFLVACQRWNLAPADVAYVGDRTDVDAMGAWAAGMRCFLITPHVPRVTRKDRHHASGSLDELDSLCCTPA